MKKTSTPTVHAMVVIPTTNILVLTTNILILAAIFFLSACHKANDGASNIVMHHDSVSNTDWAVDTAHMTITVTPVFKDNSPQLQQCIKYQGQHPGYVITPAAGNFYLYEPLVVDTMLNGVLRQSWLNIVGATDAKDASSAYTTNFICMFNQGFAIGVENCKGCVIQNINFQGQYTLPNSLSEVQIDTMSYAAWNDGVSGMNCTSPYTAVAIDPFSDSGYYDGVRWQMYPGLHKYYQPGMTQSGSTDVSIINCRASQFVVGFIVTPSFQLNGDNINFNNDRVDICRDGIAFTQAQSKMCEINDLMSWGQIFSVFDGINYGSGGGGGSTFANINGVSIAGNTHQIFNVEAKSFPLNASNVFADNVYKIGEVIGMAGTLFNGFQVDFQVAAAGVPSPDFYYYGFMTTWYGCMLRVYNNGLNGVNNRIVMNMANNNFIGGQMSSPPICANEEEILRQVQPGNYPATFTNVSMYYTSPYVLNVNSYDSMVLLSSADTMTINPASFTGSFVCPAKVGNGISIGEPIVAFKFYNEVLLTQYDSYEYPAGFVTSVSKGSVNDTVYLRNTGQGIYTGNVLKLWDAKIKTSVY